MQLLIIKAILLSIQTVFCLKESNIQFLVDYAYSNSLVRPQQYPDDIHRMPFSSFQLNPVDPSFTIVGKLTITIVPTYFINIFQIYNTQTPDKKLVMFGYDNSQNALFVRQQYNTNSYQGEILCSNYQAVSGSFIQFTLSMKKTSTSIKIDFVISKGTQSICSQSTTISSNMLNWNFNDYTVQLSDSGSLSLSRDEYSSYGTVYNVFLIRDTYVGSFGDVVRNFIKRLALNTQEALNAINRFNPNSQVQFTCVPDESIVRHGCGKPTNNLPLINNGIATFSAGQDILYKNFNFNNLFNHFYRYPNGLSSYITYSFWICLDNNSITTRQIFKVTELYKFILNLIQHPNGYQIQIQSIDQSNVSKIFTFSQSLSLNQYYYIILSYHYSVNSQDLRIIVINNNGILSEELFSNIDQLKFPSTITSIQIGSNQNSMNTIFHLSQFQINLSSAILYDEQSYPNIMNQIINNCQVVILVRLKYECLVCKKGYYLFENQCNDENNNPCNSDYFPESKTRSCIRKCSYICSTCDQNNPNICTSCSSNDRDILTNCSCKSGFEDLISKECSQFRSLNINNSEIEDIYLNLNAPQTVTTITYPFRKQFKNTPYLISMLSLFYNGSSYMRGIKVKISNISNKQFKFDYQGSYGGTSQATVFSYQILALDSDSGKYYSKFLQFDTPESETYQQDIDIGTYDQDKYGDYQILTFISGVFMGQDTSFTLLQSDFSVEVVTVNDYVKLVQVTYLVLPTSIPTLTQSFNFNPGTFFNDSGNQFQGKLHTDTISITNNLLLQKRYLFASYSSLTAINVQLKPSFRLAYKYASQNDLDKQYTRFEVDSNQVGSYKSNGFYLIEEQNLSKDTCIIKDMYTQYGCYKCIDFADINTYCKTCLGNRVLKQSSCDCPDLEYTKFYAGQPNCSYKETAVLDINLSTDFTRLTIEFGLPIEPIKYQPYFEPNQELCQQIFTPETLLLISKSANCQIIDSLLLVDLDYDATILQGHIVKLQNLKFIKYSEKITKFYRTKVYQDQLLYEADVEIQYSNEVTICDSNIIQVLKFINDQRRGVSSYSWSLFSQQSPNNSNDLIKIQGLFDKANSKKQLFLITKGYFSENSVVTILFKYTYKIGKKGEKYITFKVVQKFNLILTSKLMKTAPYYKYFYYTSQQNINIFFKFRKDQIEIFYTISYFKCDANGKIIQISPAIFNLQYQASNNLQLTNTVTSTTEKQFSLVIPQFKTQSNIVYKITIICTVSGTSGTYQIDYYLPITPVPLLIQIKGGNRLHDYNEQLTLEALVKDLDVFSSSDQSKGINLSWSCSSLESGKPCVDIEGSVINISQGTNQITFQPNTFICFQTFLFTIIGAKDTRKEQSQITISFIDRSIPLLYVNFQDDFLLKKTVNLNDVIEANIVLDSQEDVNKLFFGGAIIYNKKVQSQIVFEYGKIRIQLWDYFTNVDTSNPKFQLRFMVFNPKYTQPSQMFIQLQMNFPPQNCVVDISPLTGDSLITRFTISANNCQDPDQPIQYQFYYYSQLQLFDFEKKNPMLVQRKQITDKQFNQAVETFLPPGDILILIQAIDSLGAIQNITKSLTVKQSIFSQQEYVNQIQYLIDYSEKQILPIQTLTLSLLCEDMVSRPEYYQTIRNQASQIVNSLQILTNKISIDSTFSILTTQSIQLVINSKILQADNLLIQQNMNFMSGVLDKASEELKQDKYLQDKSNQQLYNCFKLLDNLVDISQTIQADQQNLISQSSRLGNLLNVDAYPNESAKVLKGIKISIISQVVTKKKLPYYLGLDDGSANWESSLSEQAKDDPTNQIYEVSFKSFDENIYENEKEFQNFKEKLKEAKPTITLNSYKAINPKIILEGSNDDQVLDSTVKLTFQPKDSENLTCINKVQGQWSAQGCISNYDKKTKSYNCICDSLSPTTVINDIADIFEDNKNINTVFSEDGIKNIVGFDNFQDYAAFWVWCFITIIFIILSVFGIFLDSLKPSQQSSGKIYPTIEQSPSSKPLQATDNLTFKFDEMSDNIEERQTFNNVITRTRVNTDFDKPNIDSAKNNFALDTESALKNSHHILDSLSSKNLNINQHKRNKMKTIKEEEDNQIKSESKQFSRQISESSIFSKKLKKTQIHLDTSIINGKDKLETIKFYKQSLYFHDLLSIFLIYDPSISRLQRITIIYLKNLHIFAFNIIFNQKYSIVQIIFLQLINIIAAVLITKLIELGISKNNLLRRLCKFLIISLIIFYVYDILAIISGTQPEETNLISKYYFVILLIDIFGVGVVLSFLQRFIAMYLLKNQQNLTGFKLKIFEYLKLQLILVNI